MLTGVYQDDRIQYKKTTTDDCLYLAKNLRPADKAELDALESNATYFELIWHSKRLSKECYSCFVNNKLLCIFGVIDNDDEGIIWLLATRTNKLILDTAPIIIKNLYKKYMVLTNYIHTNNKLHIKWLEKLGFKIKNTNIEGFKLFYGSVNTSN